MISFDAVSFAYPNGAKVLDNITFTIKKGEHVGLIGANGAGKSTMMKSALGLLMPQGTIQIDGHTITKDSLPEIRKALGYVLQDSDNQMFMPKVIDDMIFGPMNYGLNREEALKKADEILEKLDLVHLKDRYNHKISGGEKRMAAIATILAMEPKAVLMDEPSASLDPYNRRNLIRTLNSLTDLTMVIASHDLDMILETCDRVLLLGNGRIQADGPAMEILTNQELLESNHLELPFCLAGVPKR